MGKYRVKVFYEFMAVVEVEANDINEAYEKGRQECHNIPNSELEYIEEGEAFVIPYGKDGKLDYSKETEF